MSSFLDVINGVINDDSVDLSTYAENDYASFMKEGKHNVKVEAIELLTATKGMKSQYLKVTFTNEVEANHNETLFLLNKERDGLSHGLSSFLAALFRDSASIKNILSEVGKDDRAWEMLKGMRLTVLLERENTGYRIVGDKASGYRTVDKSGKDLGVTADSVKELNEKAKAANMQRAWLRVANYKTTDDDTAKGNVAVLAKAVTQPKPQLQPRVV